MTNELEAQLLRSALTQTCYALGYCMGMLTKFRHEMSKEESDKLDELVTLAYKNTTLIYYDKQSKIEVETK